MSKVYDSLMKSGKFTAAQNKAETGEFVDSIGELIELCEKQGYIERYYIESPKDRVDLTIADMQRYTRTLIEEETNLTKKVRMNPYSIIVFDEIEKQMNEFFENNKDDLSTCEFLFPDVLDRMIKENKVRVKVLPTTAKWFGATYREDLDNIKNSIKELVAEGAYNENLWS